MKSLESTEKQYRKAVELVVEKAKQDPQIIAGILYGSLSHDQVWEKSDLDLWLVTVDNPKDTDFYSLVSNDIFMHVDLIPRSQFRRNLESGLVTSWSEMVFVRSTLLFSHDETIKSWFDQHNRYQVGSRDKQFALLRVMEQVIPQIETAEKEFYLKQDPAYAFLAILRVVDTLASFEVILNGEVPGREKIQPALQYNPDFFSMVYSDFINQPKTDTHFKQTLSAIRQYMGQHTWVYRPILDYLCVEGGLRSTTEIDAFLEQSSRQGSHYNVYRWMAQNGILQRAAIPTSLTYNSQLKLDEASYGYNSKGTPVHSTPNLEQVKTALGLLAERVQQDHNVVAAFLFGDLAEEEDQVWPASPIPIMLIVEDKVKTASRYFLVENQVDLQVDVEHRSNYRRKLGKALVGDWEYNRFINSKIIFTKDKAIHQWHFEIQGKKRQTDTVQTRSGTRDTKTQLMNLGCGLAGTLAKAEKWCYVKNDPDYSFIYILYVVQDLAKIEVFQNQQIPDKKPIHQALELNPNFFQAVFTDLLDQPKSRLTIMKTLTLLNDYLAERTQVLFQPILEFLQSENRACTATDLYHHFGSRSLGGAVMGCEWMVREGLLQRVGVPMQITPNSPEKVEEIAYFYDFLDEDFF